MVAETLTISREDLPSGKYDVTIKCPKFGDYRKARKIYPSDDQKRPGYSVEELLFAMQLEDIVEETGFSILDKSKPKDIADRLKLFTIADRQALLMIFLEIFWLSVEKARIGRDLANEYMLAPAFSYELDADKMPSGELAISYYSPNTGTQLAADRRYQGPQQQGCSLEELLFAMCLQTVNGEDVQTPNDIISILDNWEISDVQFGNLVFINQFTLDDSGAEKAKEAGKRYREKLGSKVSEVKPRSRRTTTTASETPTEQFPT